VCYRFSSAGFTEVCYRRRAGSIDSLVCVTGLAQLGVTYVCYRHRAGSIDSLVCVTGLAQLSSLRCVTGAGLAQLIHLCVLQV
jgi:hypothetical protein